MKKTGRLWALALVSCAFFVEGPAAAAGGQGQHWSDGLTTATGEPMAWLPNCSPELTKLDLKRCLSSRLVPQSVAVDRLQRVHDMVARVGHKHGGGSSCGQSNGPGGGGGGDAGPLPVGLGADGLQKAYTLLTPGLPDGTGMVVGIVQRLRELDGRERSCRLPLPVRPPPAPGVRRRGRRGRRRRGRPPPASAS